VYLGVSFGSVLQVIADRYGRYQVISLAGILQIVAGILSALASNYDMFLIIRFVYGIGIGIVLPLSATYLSEITPNNSRAMLLSWSRIYWSTGAVLTCALAYFLLGHHYWRWLLTIICVPGIIATYLHLSTGKESPRFLLLHSRYQ
jgi:MFS family permease